MFGLFNKKKTLEDDAVALFSRLSAGEGTAEDSDQLLNWAENEPGKLDDLELLSEIWDEAGQVQLDRSIFFDEEENLAPAGWWQKAVNYMTEGWQYPVGTVAAAALAVFLVVTIVSPFSGSQVISYDTERGALETVKLPDGSEIYLNGLSRVDVAYTDSERRITMLDGEVYYEVSSDKERPFIVETSGVEVRAVGTAFDIERAHGAVTVIVTEGIVSISFDGKIERYDAGNKIEVLQSDNGANFRVTKLAFSDFEDAVTWRSGVISFSGEPLSLALERINRQSVKPIVLADPGLANLQIFGSFRQGNVDSFINAVEALYPVRIVESQSRIALYERNLIKEANKAGDSNT